MIGSFLTYQSSVSLYFCSFLLPSPDIILQIFDTCHLNGTYLRTYKISCKARSNSHYYIFYFSLIGPLILTYRYVYIVHPPLANNFSDNLDFVLPWPLLSCMHDCCTLLTSHADMSFNIEKSQNVCPNREKQKIPGLGWPEFNAPPISR